MESATWCRTPAADSAATRLRLEVSKNFSTALSSNEGELARSITTCAPATASLSPSPGIVLIPFLGGGGDALVAARAQNSAGLRADQASAADHDDLHGGPPFSRTGNPR